MRARPAPVGQPGLPKPQGFDQGTDHRDMRNALVRQRSVVAVPREPVVPWSFLLPERSEIESYAAAWNFVQNRLGAFWHGFRSCPQAWVRLRSDARSSGACMKSILARVRRPSCRFLPRLRSQSSLVRGSYGHLNDAKCDACSGHVHGPAWIWTSTTTS